MNKMHPTVIIGHEKTLYLGMGTKYYLILL